MASEIRVDKITHTAGVGTITPSPTGVHIAGIVTGTTFSGSGASLTNLPAASLTGTVADARFPATLPAASGANLTNLPAANLTGALPAISGANLTGIAATDNVRTGILDVAGISTFRNTMNVGAAVTISESGIEASGIGITVANINGTQIGGRRNIWINGAMEVAQRGTSSTSTGYCVVDRWVINNNAGTITKAQIDLNNTDTGPWQDGIRHALRLTNTSAIGSGAGDYAECYYRPEARDLATSGWAYDNGNSFITLSYWARSSVAQAFPATIKMDDWGYFFPWNYTIAQANVWQKFAIKIHGHSSMTINNDNGVGFTLWINAYQGSNFFSGSYTANDWNASSGSYMFAGSPTTTWGTTAGATWDITGFQLEVGPEATAFEHRSFAEEERLCQRYYFRQSAEHQYMRYACHGQTPSANGAQYVYQLPVRMRATPTLGYSQLSDFYMYAGNLQSKTPTSLAMDANSTISPMFVGAKSSTFTAGQMAHLTTPNSEQGYLEFIAEL